jgi:DNA-binding MarR family transcriptional regulator
MTVANASARRRAPARPDEAPAWLASDRERLDLKLWVRLLACAHAAEQRVKARIKEQFGINQTQFNLMSQLDLAPRGIRMGEVARRTVVTGSNVTAVVDDLERRGFVARQNADDDRRAIVIRLTAKGRVAFAEMAPIHAEWILELFAEFPESEKRSLVRQLDGLKAAMHATLSTSL